MRVALVTTFSYADALNNSQRSGILREYPFPLGLLTLAGILRDDGHRVLLRDLNLLALECGGEPQNLYRYFAERILNDRPDIVGLTTMCDSYHHTLMLAREIRSIADVPLVLGGPQATAVDVDTLLTVPEIDFIVRGEAEISFPQLLSAIEAGIGPADILGISYRGAGGSPIRNPDATPIADFNVFPLPEFGDYEYLKGTVQFVPIEAGRGCPFKCDFCSTALFFKRDFRLKTNSRLKMEIENAERFFGDNLTFRLIHDMLTVSRPLVTEMCSGLAKLEPRRRWSSSARVDCVRPPVIGLLNNAGCEELYFGIETGSQRLQKVIKKNLRLGDVLPRVNEAVGFGMTVTCSFIAGFPEETRADLAQTLDLICDIVSEFHPKISVQLHLLAPYVGTELYNNNKGKLLYDGYASDQIGQKLSSDDEEFISLNPVLFSNFFYVPGVYIDRESILGVDSFVYLGIARFPLTILFLRKAGVAPLDVFEKWQAAAISHDGRRELSALQIDADTFDQTFRRAVEDIEASGLKTSVLSIMAYEEAFLQLSKAAPKVSSHGPMVIERDISLVETEFDVSGAWSELRGEGPSEKSSDRTRYYALKFDRRSQEGIAFEIGMEPYRFLESLDDSGERPGYDFGPMATLLDKAGVISVTYPADSGKISV